MLFHPCKCRKNETNAARGGLGPGVNQWSSLEHNLMVLKATDTQQPEPSMYQGLYVESIKHSVIRPAD